MHIFSGADAGGEGGAADTGTAANSPIFTTLKAR